MDTQTVINTAVLSASPRTENKGQKAEQTAVKKGYRSNTYFLLKLLLTVSGFIIAIGVSLFFPQKAEIVIKDYALSAFGLTLNLTMNDAYIFVLVMLIVIYTVTGLVSAGNKERRKKFCKNAAFRFALGIGLALWDIGGTKLAFFPQPFFPGPAQVIEAYLSDGVPAVAWMPFALTLLPDTFTAAVFLIVICAWFQIAFLTAKGIQSTPKQSYEAARILGSSQKDLILHVAIPHAMPDIFTGIGSANAMAFTTLVMSEMLGQPGGLGYYINQSKVWSAYYKVLAAIVIMAVLFSFINYIIGRIQKHTLRWQEGVLKK